MISIKSILKPLIIITKEDLYWRFQRILWHFRNHKHDGVEDTKIAYSDIDNNTHKHTGSDGTEKTKHEDHSDGIQVKVGSFTCPAGIGNYSVTGVGFKPRYIKFKCSTDNANYIIFGTGQMDYNGNQDVQAFTGENDDQHTDVSTASCASIISDLGNTIVRASYVSMDSDGFTINFSVTNASYTIYWTAFR